MTTIAADRKQYMWLPSVTLWQREMVRFYRQKSRVIGVVASPLVFWFFLGSGFGSSFAASSSTGHSVNYLEYFFPGKPVYQIAVPIYDCYTVEPDLTKEAARKRLGIDSKHVILFFGYIREYKGLDVLIDAMPSVLKQIPDAHLLIVGESYEKISRYTEQIERLGLHKNTTLINKFVPNEEVGLYFTAGDVVCLPYRSATQSGPLNIAYGMGKPVIVTDVGGLAEFVVKEKTGFVVPPEQPAAIADSITGFYQRYSGVNFAEYIFEHNKQNNFNNVHTAFREIFEMRDKTLSGKKRA